jgi:hypothetical protein
MKTVTIFFFSSTTLYEFRIAQLFLSIVSSLAPSVSSSSLPSFSGHFSCRLPILILAFLSVLLRTVSIYIQNCHDQDNDKRQQKEFKYDAFFTRYLSCGGSGSCILRQSDFEGGRQFGLGKPYAWPVPIKTHTNLARMLHSV